MAAGVGELEITCQWRGRRNRELEGRLEVGLLEHGEDAARVGYLELGVEVDLVVLGVHEAVQTLAGVHERAIRDHGELVVLGEARERDAAVLEVGRGVKLLTIEGDGDDLRGDRGR